VRSKEILLATTNLGKLKEIRKILKLRRTNFLSYSDMPFKIKIIENGKTFQENSIKKAVLSAKKFNIVSIAEDSGLCVDSLDGQPGIKSARFVRPPVTKERLCKKLLSLLKSKKNRKAKFVCSVTVAFPDGRYKNITRYCYGKISDKMFGENGFGYDPVFIPKGYKKTFGQMSDKKKNVLSHRGKAFRDLRKELLDLGF